MIFPPFSIGEGSEFSDVCWYSTRIHWKAALKLGRNTTPLASLSSLDPTHIFKRGSLALKYTACWPAAHLLADQYKYWKMSIVRLCIKVITRHHQEFCLENGSAPPSRSLAFMSACLVLPSPTLDILRRVLRCSQASQAKDGKAAVGFDFLTGFFLKLTSGGIKHKNHHPPKFEALWIYSTHDGRHTHLLWS